MQSRKLAAATDLDALTAEEVAIEYGFVPSFTRNGRWYDTLLEAVEQPGSLTFDYAALNIFFRVGMFFDGATPFREIRRYMPPPVIIGPSDITRGRAIEAYIELFSASIKRLSGRASAVALSGGRDSRHILLELCKQGRLPQYAITIGVPGREDETNIARALTTRLGVRHKIVSVEHNNWVQDEVLKDALTDFSSLQHGWMARVACERDSLDWWDGIAGDVLSAGQFVNDWTLRCFRENRLDEFADRLCWQDRIPYFKDPSLFPREAAVAAVRAQLSRHVDAADPVNSFFLWNRTRIDIGSSAFGMLGRKGRVLAPYLDGALFSHLASLPAEMTADHTFHTETIRRAYPTYADIPYADKDRAPTSFWRRQALNLLRYTIVNGAADPKHWLKNVARAAYHVARPARTYGVLKFTPYMIELQRLARFSGRLGALRTS